MREVRVRLWAVYCVAGLLGLAVFALMASVISSSATDRAVGAVEQNSARGCDRNQVQRGYLILRAREFVLTDQKQSSRTTELAEGYFLIVNCKATYINSPTEVTYLSPPLQECFLKLLRDKSFGEHAEHVTTDPQQLHVEYDCT